MCRIYLSPTLDNLHVNIVKGNRGIINKDYLPRFFDKPENFNYDVLPVCQAWRLCQNPFYVEVRNPAVDSCTHVIDDDEPPLSFAILQLANVLGGDQF